MNRVGAIALLAVCVFIGINALRFQHRGTVIAGLEADTTALYTSLNQTRKRETAYAQDNTRLRGDSARLSGQVSTLTGRATDAENASLQARIDLTGANTRIAQSVAAMTALQRKQAADADGGGIGIVPTTVADSGANAAIASLKGQVREKDGVIIALTSENSALKAENGTLKEEVSDLERSLNGARGEVKAAVRGVLEQPKGFPVGRLARERKRMYKVLAN